MCPFFQNKNSAILNLIIFMTLKYLDKLFRLQFKVVLICMYIVSNQLKLNFS